MITETTPNFIAFAGPRCACCGRAAERLINCPGNILAPACRDADCGFATMVGIIECTSSDVSAALAEVAGLVRGLA